MNTRQRAALANPNLEFGASTFLGQPVGPNQMLLVYVDQTGEEVSFPLKSLFVCPDGTEFPKRDLMALGNPVTVVLPSNFGTLQSPEEGFAGYQYLETIIGLEDLTEIPTAFCVECPLLQVKKLNALVINENAFANCMSLQRVELPNVKNILPQAFGSCENATIVLNENVENVANYAFNNVDNLIYHGSLPGAPWGAQKWNGVSQN